MNRRQTLIALALAVGVGGCGGAGRSEVESAPRVRAIIGDGRRARFELVGLDPVMLEGLRRPLSEARWETLFALRVAAWDSTSPAVAGRYDIRRDRITFTPEYPLVAGTEYLAMADLDRLAEAAGVALPHCGGRLFARTSIATPAPKGRWLVTHVYPSADTLPANLLKFYIHFSQPMRPGDAADHLALIDQDGNTVAGAFLPVDDELWDRSGRRLTVLLDPGRVKRGLRPNRELGAPLVTGHRYRLRIDSAWRDAEGDFLGTSYEKSFQVTGPDRAAPDVRTWQVTAPVNGTRDPIEIRFPEPFDNALLGRMVGVRGPDGAALAVRVTTAENERVLWLQPEQPWKAGPYQVVVGAELEDLAGNTFGRVFDLDLSDSSTRPDDELSVLTIPIRIRG